MKKKKPAFKILPWLPRILSILVLVMISIFFWLNFLGQNLSTGLSLDLFMQSVPLFLTMAIIALAWKKESVGIIFFPLIGLIYFLITPDFLLYNLAVFGSFLLTAILYWVVSYTGKRVKQFSESAFTIIEYIVVVFIIALLSTGASIIYAGLRIKLNDTKRVADLKSISMALDAYYRKEEIYPSVLGNGALAGPNGQVYLIQIPSDPIHPGNSICPPGGYQYFNLGSSYQLNACLDGPVGGLLPGSIVIKPESLPTNITRVSGLVGYWIFDEGGGPTAVDYSGYVNNGTWYGTGPTHYDTSYDGTRAAKFNGVNDYVKVPSTSLLNASSLTIALWAKADEITGHNYILEKGNPSQFGISLENGQNHGELEFFLDDSGTCNNKTKSFEGNVILTTNVWNFIAVTFDDPSNVLRIYVNGQLDKQYVYSGCVPINNGDLMIGRKVTGSQGYEYGGLMDNVSFYNRALTSAEILTIYNATK
jgi:type II secretory pathway pseudopilin PulG